MAPKTGFYCQTRVERPAPDHAFLDRHADVRRHVRDFPLTTADQKPRQATGHNEGETYWYVYNGHGDVIGLVDAAGAMIARYEYDSGLTVNAGFRCHGARKPL